MAARADLVLLTEAEVAWAAPYVGESHVASLTDVDGLVRLAAGLNLDGVLTYDEALVQRTAELAARLGLGNPTPEAVRLCKDKSALRDRLTKAGLSPVRHGIAHTFDEAREVAARIGYPLVCKPPALGGSIGVVRVDDEEQLVESFGLALDANYLGQTSAVAGVLIEEYLDGPEYSVDCAVWDGVAHPLVVANKELAFPPYFEELAHVVPAVVRPGLDKACEMVVDAHCVLGLDRLVTHTEFKLTSRGPRIVEVNARLGGDLIPYLGALATGVDLAGAAADIALGIEPDIRAITVGVASILMIYPPHAMRFEGLALRHRRDAYPGLVDLFSFQQPGAELRLPPEGFLSRVGCVVVTGATHQECRNRRAAVEADLVVTGTPLDGA